MSYKDGRPEMFQWEVKDDIVLSGISGYFPQADGIEEFQQKLYNGVDMVILLMKRLLQITTHADVSL